MGGKAGAKRLGCRIGDRLPRRSVLRSQCFGMVPSACRAGRLRGDEMNKTRRKELDAVLDLLEDARANLETCIDGEQDYIDNMPEGLADSERASAAQDAIDTMQSALDGIESAIESINESKGQS